MKGIFVQFFSIQIKRAGMAKALPLLHNLVPDGIALFLHFVHQRYLSLIQKKADLIAELRVIIRRVCG